MPWGAAKKKKKLTLPPGVKDSVSGPILQMGKTKAERDEVWPQSHTYCKWGDCNAVVRFPREEMRPAQEGCMWVRCVGLLWPNSRI